MEIEEEYQDILLNIELSIISVYRETPDLIDAEVLSAIDALVRFYSAQAQGKSPAVPTVRGISKLVMERVMEQIQIMFEVGKSNLRDAPTPISLEVMVACLRRIQSSIKFWSKKSGRQGYLSYVDQFIG
uniref:Uncharacterized protein n=1 Tax=Cyanothece sp. (strain PCC 7425 / ATCC 29141) TaxID=395961 RepID=B8HUZ5_CYAP4